MFVNQLPCFVSYTPLTNTTLANTYLKPHSLNPRKNLLPPVGRVDQVPQGQRQAGVEQVPVRRLCVRAQVEGEGLPQEGQGRRQRRRQERRKRVH